MKRRGPTRHPVHAWARVSSTKSEAKLPVEIYYLLLAENYDFPYY